MASVLLGGSQAMLSHRSAAELWELLDPIEGPAHVTVVHTRRGPEGVRFHCSRDLGDRTMHDRIPVTTVPRTLLDLAAVVSPTQLRRAFEEAERRGELDRGAVARLCERSNGRRGLGALRALLDERLVPLVETRSGLERRFLRYCHERGLPIPAVNAPLAGYVVDCVWPAHRVAVELDSWTHHGSREAFESDRKRDARIQLAGYRVVRVTHRRIVNQGNKLEVEIRQLLGAGSAATAGE
jgi:hypothetical protein